MIQAFLVFFMMEMMSSFPYNWSPALCESAKLTLVNNQLKYIKMHQLVMSPEGTVLEPGALGLQQPP